MRNLKFTLITASLNSEKTIKDSLDSVYNQSYKNIEHIIIDSKSTDKTISIVEKYSHVTKIISEPDKGIYDALNKGIKYSTGDIIGFLHSDDYFSNNKVVEKIVKKFAEKNDLNAVYADCEFFSKKDKKKIIRKWISKPYDKKLLLNGWMPPHASLYVRTKLIKSVNGFDSTFKISGDYDCILKMFTQNNFKAHHIPEVILKMSMGGKSNRSISDIILKTKEDWRALRQNNYNFFLSLKIIILKNLSKLIQFF